MNGGLPARVAALYPFRSQFFEQPAGKMHYLDEGPPEAPVVVCLHGNPTWSFYFRRIILALRATYRVVVPDHMGCGLSDKPQRAFNYRLRGHIDNLKRLLDYLRLEPATFVLHDWGGAIGMGVCTAESDRARGFVVTNTAAFRSRRIPPSISSVRVPLFGPLAVRGLNGFARAALFRATEKGLSPEVRAGLLYPYNSWANRIATLRFVEDIPMHAKHPSWETLTRIEVGLGRLRDHPMRILWGDADWCFGPPFRRAWAKRFPKAEVSGWTDAGHYLFEDAPDRCVTEIRRFLSPTTSNPPRVSA